MNRVMRLACLGVALLSTATAVAATPPANVWILDTHGALVASMAVGLTEDGTYEYSAVLGTTGQVVLNSPAPGAPLWTIPGSTAQSQVLINHATDSFPPAESRPSMSLVSLGEPTHDASTPGAPGVASAPPPGTYPGPLVVGVAALPASDGTQGASLELRVGNGAWSPVAALSATVVLDSPGETIVTVRVLSSEGAPLVESLLRYTLTPGGTLKDGDGDGLADLLEPRLGLVPGRDDATVDSDGDGVSDLDEVIRGTDPRSAASQPADADGDGWFDWDEVARGTSPTDSTKRPTARRTTEVEHLVTVTSFVDTANTEAAGGAGQVAAVDATGTEVFPPRTVTSRATFSMRLPASLPQVVALRGLPDADWLAVQRGALWGRADVTSRALASWHLEPADPLVVANPCLSALVTAPSTASITCLSVALQTLAAARLVRSVSLVLNPATAAPVALLEAERRWTNDDGVVVGPELSTPHLRFGWPSWTADTAPIPADREATNALLSALAASETFAPISARVVGRAAGAPPFDGALSQACAIVTEADAGAPLSPDATTVAAELVAALEATAPSSTETRVRLLARSGVARVLGAAAAMPSVLDPDADPDQDGLSTRDELTARRSLSTDPLTPDTDADGLLDGADPCGVDATNTCSTAWAGNGDADGDGVPDGADNCPMIANATQGDTNGDAIGDACPATARIVAPATNLVVAGGGTVSFHAALDAGAPPGFKLAWFRDGKPLGAGGLSIEAGIPATSAIVTIALKGGLPGGGLTLLDHRTLTVLGSGTGGPTLPCALAGCDDANACTVDTCTASVCVHSAILGCVPCDSSSDCDAVGATTCAPSICDFGQGRCVGGAGDKECDDGDACTTDTCAEGVGCKHLTVTCSDGVDCTEDTCSPDASSATGSQYTCTHVAKAGLCADTDTDPCTIALCSLEIGCHLGPKCTDSDLCSDSVCQPDGTCLTVVAAACDDGHACTVDHCAANPDYVPDGASPSPIVCTHTPENAQCADGLACTEDVCDADLGCTNSEACDDGSACTTDACEPDGACSHLADVCDDGAACTDDSCAELSGPDAEGNPVVECTHAPRPGCTACSVDAACDDQNACTDHRCIDGVCTFKPATNGAECDDAEPCTTADACKDGQCLGGAPPGCADDANACTLDVCVPGLGCDHVAKPGCTPCAVELQCKDANACTADACVLGQCVHAPVAAPSCEDGDPCTVAEHCDAGSCVPTAGIAPCDDQNPCTLDTCVGGQLCENLAIPGCQRCADDVDCSDGSPCTAESCLSEGTCGAPEPLFGPCSDGDACTLGDACVDGQCVAGVETPLCDDGKACTADACDAGSGCVAVVVPGCVACANAADCSDGDPCTTDGCPGGACIFTAKADGALCGLPSGCTVPQCSAGLCQSGPAENGFACNDGSPCSTDDTCTNGQCQGLAGGCDDLNPCTTDACVTGQACTHTPVAGCTYCNANGDCPVTQGGCLVSLCVNHQCGAPVAQNGTLCDDGDLCTLNEVCVNGVCDWPAEIQFLNCDDDDPCTDDYCGSPYCGEFECPPEMPYGCQNLAFTPCTTCASAIDCTDGNPCTKDTCYSDPYGCTGAECNPLGYCSVSHPKDNTALCDDGNPCTEGDYCLSSVCQAGAPKVCNDGDTCTLDSCSAGTCGAVFDTTTDPDVCPRCTTSANCTSGTCIAGDCCTPTILPDGQVRVYDPSDLSARVLCLPKGAGLSIRATGTSGAFSLKLVDRMGKQVAFGSHATSLYIEALDLTEGGRYTLTPAFGTPAVAHDVQVFLVPPPVAVASAADGVARSAANTVPGQTVAFSFERTAGQRFSIPGTGASSCTSVKVIDPTGAVISGPNATCGTAFTDAVQATVTGTYIAILDPSSFTVSNQTATIYDVPPDPTATITVPEAITPLVTTAPGQNAKATFTGVAGDRVTVTVVLSPGTGCHAFTLRAPSGASAGTDSSCGSTTVLYAVTLLESGVYTVEINPSSTGFGTYGVTVWFLAPDAVVSLTAGSAASGSAPKPGNKVFFEIAATAGQRVAFRVTYSQSSTCYATSASNTNGASLGTDNTCGTTSWFDSFVVPVDGLIKVTADSTSTGTPNVTLTSYLVPDDAFTPITINGPAVAQTNAIGQVLYYSFEGTAGQVIHFTSTRLKGCMVHRLFNSAFAQIYATGNSCANTNTSASITLPSNGTYYIVENAGEDIVDTFTVQLFSP